MKTPGQRLPDGFHAIAPAGSYWRNEKGQWEACTPNRRRGLLTDHTVTEHADGSITVDPSIDVKPLDFGGAKGIRPGWHGFLEKGIWSEV